MSKLLSGSLFFISGAAIASFITYKLVEKKFKDLADEEIESVRAVYEHKLEKNKPAKDEKEETKQKGITAKILTTDDETKINPYSSLVNDLGYSNNKKEEKEDMAVDNNIEVIPPEDFGEYGFKCESLTYYKDRVLTFDNDEKITDVEKYVGPDALNTFGEYEDDSVFVRNHGMKTDFEILLDSRTYSEVVGTDDVYTMVD